MNRRWYEWMLTIVYFAMVGLCVFLNFSKGHQESLATIIVNIVMFVIVAFIFLSADIRCFGPTNSIIKDLRKATLKIKNDAMNTHSYLWTPYQTGNVELFANNTLKDLFRDFVFELNREHDPKNVYYKPNIDDYINEDLVDSTMHRNELNQVAGMLTGLGILGTFIGLSLGLQSFNTGSTAEITSSIEPLMNGIKVAFHTSIYGMVFSLSFNAILKKKMYEAEEAVFAFTSAFKKYVLPDTANNGMNQLLAIQREQLDAMEHFTGNIAGELAEAIKPTLMDINTTVENFANVATANQTEAMQKIVEYFISQMNTSLHNSFWQLSQTVEEIYQSQKKNAALMQESLNTTRVSTGNLQDINKETEKLIIILNRYSESIQAIQNEMQQTIAGITSQIEHNQSMILRERNVIKDQDQMLNDMKAVVDKFAVAAESSSIDITAALEQVNDSLIIIRKSIDKQQQDPKGRK